MNNHILFFIHNFGRFFFAALYSFIIFLNSLNTWSYCVRLVMARLHSRAKSAPADTVNMQLEISCSHAEQSTRRW